MFGARRKHGVTAIAILALGGTGCALPSTYGSEDSSGTKRPHQDADDSAEAAATTATTERAAFPDDVSSSAASSAAALTPAGPCAAQTVTWTVSGSTCTASAEALADGAIGAVTDSTLDDTTTGKVSVACSGGKLVLSSAVCGPPASFDVDNATGCVNGYCKATVSGQCGTPDPKRADEVCVAKGFGAATTYTTINGPNGARQCSGDGTSCFTNANPSCNIVFKAIGCRY